MRNKLRSYYSELLTATVSHIIHIMVIISSKRCNLSTTVWLLHLVAFIFKKYLSSYYSVVNAKSLAQKMLLYKSNDFSRKFIINKLLSQYIKDFVSTMSWSHTLCFLKKNCKVRLRDTVRPGKLLLCTHTGDYWLLILSLARLYTGKNCDFIVPIFQKITPKNQMMYNKINIPGVNVLFINIHDNGAILRISKMLKDPKCVVAIFYDLPCYVRNVYNGAVNPVTFLGRQGHMTTGILAIARRLKIKTNVVTCAFSFEKHAYLTEVFDFTYPENLSEQSEQSVVVYLEEYLYHHPWQWHFVGFIDAYFHYPYSALISFQNRSSEQYNRLQNKYLRLG
ncbi:hypothetical protein ABFY47_25050 [Enterobacter ludwigii]|uniref:hypothetical protein n=1 Tax=Enterobacter ludwigii TaxID=299767 RepID=UPI003D224622